MRYRFVTLIFLVSLALSPYAYALDITEVVTASPSWKTFTNKDGSGLYHEVLKEVFSLYAIPVRHVYSKSGRAEKLVATGSVDMMTCKDKDTLPLILARYPMYEDTFFVFFKKDRIGPWQGDESLRGKEILSQPTYYDESNFNVPVTIKEIATGVQAFGMILLDRSDFYVDDMSLIIQSLKENQIEFDLDEFEIRKVGRRSYYPLLKDTERGRTIKKLYDDGIYKLHKMGKLKPIYDKWGHLYPDFDKR
jgi:hypothetical protein